VKFFKEKYELLESIWFTFVGEETLDSKGAQV
jgi:hypothetical protein